jgi:hypothetical protein
MGIKKKNKEATTKASMSFASVSWYPPGITVKKKIIALVFKLKNILDLRKKKKKERSRECGGVHKP